MVAWSYGRRDRGRALGYGIGVLSTTPTVPEALPEFASDQTDDDLLPEAFLAENDGLNPESTRFVGRINGYDIYLAQNTQLNGVCIVALTTVSNPNSHRWAVPGAR